MTRRASQIGFSQRVRLEWFDQTASLVLAGYDKMAINDAMQDFLLEKVSVGGHTKRGNREKVITILLKAWLTVPSTLEPLRNRALELIERIPREDHVAVHWGMVMAVYPFWADVARNVGRLLILQGAAAASPIQRRIREQYGDRETVSRATRRVLRSFVDWRVLTETKTNGLYHHGETRRLENQELVTWLIEALLHGRPSARAPLRELLNNNCLFPFQLKTLSAENIISTSPRLELLRHAMDENLIGLRM